MNWNSLFNILENRQYLIWLFILFFIHFYCINAHRRLIFDLILVHVILIRLFYLIHHLNLHHLLFEFTYLYYFRSKTFSGFFISDVKVVVMVIVHIFLYLRIIMLDLSFEHEIEVLVHFPFVEHDQLLIPGCGWGQHLKGVQDARICLLCDEGALGLYPVVLVKRGHSLAESPLHLGGHCSLHFEQEDKLKNDPLQTHDALVDNNQHIHKDIDGNEENNYPARVVDAFSRLIA